MMLMNFALVALGGGLGAAARYGLKLLVPSIWGTALINIIGCFLLGVLMVYMVKNSPLFLLLGIGVLGGFTTFSSFATDALLSTAKIEIGYILLSVLGSLSACYAGILLGRYYGGN